MATSAWPPSRRIGRTSGSNDLPPTGRSGRSGPASSRASPAANTEPAGKAPEMMPSEIAPSSGMGLLSDAYGQFSYFDAQLGHPDWRGKVVLDFRPASGRSPQVATWSGGCGAGATSARWSTSACCRNGASGLVGVPWPTMNCMSTRTVPRLRPRNPAISTKSSTPQTSWSRSSPARRFALP